jgi:hypothetical protein
MPKSEKAALKKVRNRPFFFLFCHFPMSWVDFDNMLRMQLFLGHVS